jgi:transglutaminase-like putative cysteine protease
VTPAAIPDLPRRAPHREEYAGPEETLRKMALKIREAARDPASLKVLQPFAEAIVREHHATDDRSVTHRRAAQLFLDHIRANVRYRPDPPLVEFVKGAALTLCVPGAEACIPIGDCDDLVTALGSLCMAYGIEVKVVAQDFGPEDDLHVILVVRDDDGSWLAADPSHPTLPVGRRLPAMKETIVDPLSPGDLNLDAPEGEFVSLGALPSFALERWVGAAADDTGDPATDAAPPAGLSVGAKVLIGAVAVAAVAGGVFLGVCAIEHKKLGECAGEAHRKTRRMAATW